MCIYAARNGSKELNQLVLVAFCLGCTRAGGRCELTMQTLEEIISLLVCTTEAHFQVNRSHTTLVRMHIDHVSQVGDQ